MKNFTLRLLVTAVVAVTAAGQIAAAAAKIKLINQSERSMGVSPELTLEGGVTFKLPILRKEDTMIIENISGKPKFTITNNGKIIEAKDLAKRIQSTGGADKGIGKKKVVSIGLQGGGLEQQTDANDINTAKEVEFAVHEQGGSTVVSFRTSK